jgi:ATP-dependent Lhr-like helicase
MPARTSSPSPLAAVEGWFARRGWSPFPFQHEVWRRYAAGGSGLIHAATGTGKTLAAWFGPLMEGLAERAADGPAPPLRVLWITPLRALAADTVQSLRDPVADLGLPWTVEARTGDTSASVKARQSARLPTALVTTPESLTLLLSRPESPRLFADLRCVVADEWHELLSSKRGVQTELALARLRRLRPGLRTWGLSATLGNLDAALSALVGTAPPTEPALVRGLVPKALAVRTLRPEKADRFPWAGHLRSPLLPQVIETVEAAGSVLVFCNVRSQAEVWYQELLEARPDWAGVMALHHGSLDRKVREWVEAGLKAGRLRCVVCTSSLDLGVDFSPVDHVVQIGSPKGVARLLQRAGRSGHRPGVESVVTCVPTNTLELIDMAAARDAAAAGEIEARPPLDKPLDVLAQHVVTIAAGTGFRRDELLAEVRTAYAYRNLADVEWDWVLDFAVRGGAALRAYPDHHRIVEGPDGVFRIRDERTARRHRMSIGTIASDTAMKVRYLRGGSLGTVEESFIAKLNPGDCFVFAGRMLELVRVHQLTAWVRKSDRTEGVVPTWQGSRVPLSTELAAAVRGKLEQARRGVFVGPEMRCVRPVLELQQRWSALPAPDELLIERLETREGHHLFVYPVEGRLVHEGLASLLAYRMGRRRPISFTLAANDYGFEMLSPDPPPLEEALADGLLGTGSLADDIAAGVNLGELSRRQFREIARVAGLVTTGFPGAGKPARQLQASAALFYDAFCTYDPDNLLLHQARREVLERQLEQSRLARVLDRLSRCRPLIRDLRRPTPFAFPLLVDRSRDKMSSEKFADRVRKMQVALEREASETDS